ncbi:helix-turn-helix domain-containing protein [Xanthobacter aminoxidans]|uniref:helix-turn-helix domain-containing protein n=1 Tax=Xanthobacter aminoxidans TaxID=186280 RepID=UPI002022D9B0|nr:helix-turn-helix domain-containing protein [Xanthobacter aminoxidans]
MGTLGKIFTMEEAAAELRISRRALQDLVKDHPHYAQNGHRKLFSESDIRALWEAMRCHSSSSRPSRAKRRTGTSAEPTSDNTLRRLRERLSKPLPESSSRPARRKSNVVGFPRE